MIVYLSVRKTVHAHEHVTFKCLGCYRNIEEPTRCNNNLLIYKISSTCFGQSFTHLQDRKTEIFTAYGMVSCCCGRQGFGEQQRGTMCHVAAL